MSVTYRPRGQLIAAGLALLAAGLMVAAMFVPYVVVTHFVEPGAEVRFEMGLWGQRVSDESVFGDKVDFSPKFGFVFTAVVVLLAAGCVALLVRRPSGRQKARLIIVAAASATVIAVAMLIVFVAPTLGWIGQGSTDRSPFDSQADLGLWLLVAAACVAAVAAGLVVRRGEPDHIEQSGVPPLREDEAVIRWVPGEPDPELR